MQFTLIIFLVLFTILFILLEVKSLLKKREFKELIVASLFFSLALLYGIDFAMDWHLLPNPNYTITIFRPISDAFESFFQVND